MCGTLKKLLRFAGSKEWTAEKIPAVCVPLRPVFALFTVCRPLCREVGVRWYPITGTDGLSGFLWASWLLSPGWKDHHDLFLHDGADGNRLPYGSGKAYPYRRPATLHSDGIF